MWKIKPAPGLRVIDPVSYQPIPESGFMLREMTTYWFRRIECKDVFAEEISEETNNQAEGGAEK